MVSLKRFQIVLSVTGYNLTFEFEISVSNQGREVSLENRKKLLLLFIFKTGKGVNNRTREITNEFKQLTKILRFSSLFPRESIVC